MPETEEMLADVCALTGMGFAAVARVTADRWVACQLLDRIEFGLKPGDELKIKTTICDEIRASGQCVFIDEVSADPSWRTHHTPAMYGFESYISIPIILEGGRFFGTLCAIDPVPRTGLKTVVPQMEAMAFAIARALDEITPDASR
ncbi:MAG: GAF domain-containing protein [Sphingomonadales bacterium]|nr:MAG: GAF domain-containing protein [Sphingomonadales bacterium]